LTDEPRPRDWETLGVEPGAEPGEVYRAYLYRKSLYAPDSLATYMLHDEEDRAELFARIEEAYRRIAGVKPPAPGSPPAIREAPVEEIAPAGPPPPIDEQPGAHLQHHRRRLTISLEQLAIETKVRATLLEQLETENFAVLPAAVYVRGFVIQYAKVLDLADPEGLAAAYLAKMEREKQPDE
jgi:hypothetical protein